MNTKGTGRRESSRPSRSKTDRIGDSGSELTRETRRKAAEEEPRRSVTRHRGANGEFRTNQLRVSLIPSKESALFLDDGGVLGGLRQHDAVHALRPRDKTPPTHGHDGAIAAPQAPGPHGVPAALE